MSYKKYNDDFSFEVVESGQKDSSGDYIYFYKILSSQPEKDVKHFCIENLYPKPQKDNPFSPIIIEFKNATNLGFPEGDIYYYKIKKLKTS
ncbi:hypothetical protein [Tenacibaculum singaporense]|uniref:Uncharacterized protein n=1 Tax=Tenacibaculum singaporense TaxID=2358479 RepID=A0A3Q8RMT9_9FLAO|nr:hypothetical protein [Tenacibaculum singaporense]AZJ35142.1 hypothetical protein D6T69_06240 [Tenacibaculum singaporense]